MHRICFPILTLVVAFVYVYNAAGGESPEKVSLPTVPSELRVVAKGGAYDVEIHSSGQTLLCSPPEGLWSIATAWESDWPDKWLHARATEHNQLGPWTVLSGVLETPQGRWQLRDSYCQDGPAVKCLRRFTFLGKKTAEQVTLSVRFQSPAPGAKVMLPGIIYYGNPMGAKSGRVPVYFGQPDEEAVFEEHRFPIPFAAIEWRGESIGSTAKQSNLLGAALHSLPSPVRFGNLPDQWWSLGLRATADCTELKLLSGPICANGRRSVVKAVQQGFLPYDNAYLNVPPDATIEKTFWLEAYPVSQEGSGFRRPLHTSVRRLRPAAAGDTPSFAEIVRAKYRFVRSRWLEFGEKTESIHGQIPIAGFKKFPDRDIFVLGWCGQAAGPAYALILLRERLEDKGSPDPKPLEMAQKSLNFLSTAEFYAGGFHTWYDCGKKSWFNKELLSQGQAMLNFAQAVRVGREKSLNTERWEAFLRRACDLHADRILAADWRPLSTNEAFFIAPLCKAAVLFQNDSGRADKYRLAAVKAARHYAARHLSMKEPYWGGTLDASCEDKEGAYAALQGFLAVYELTGEKCYLDWAEHACDVVLTYVVLWDIDLPAGRLRDHGFKTRGWTVVSPQNQHIDVYGVLIAPDVFRLGTHLKREELRNIALLMYRSCGQLIDPSGSQGEQLQHTNFAQRGNMTDVFSMRGQYAEDWTVFWITSHFLVGAAELAEQGVDVTAPAALAE